MPPSTVAAIACLLAGAVSVLVGEQALADAQDLVALYWLATGAVALKAAHAFAERRAS
jgi:hypothetical protein